MEPVSHSFEMVLAAYSLGKKFAACTALEGSPLHAAKGGNLLHTAKEGSLLHVAKMGSLFHRAQGGVMLHTC